MNTHLAMPSRQFSATAPHVIIIGGGASGAVMATHLLSQAECAFRVTIIEGQNDLGRGLAYSTKDPDHLLNTRAQNMSAFPDQPDHFANWVKTCPDAGKIGAQDFAGREVYGRYITSLLAPWRDGAKAGQLSVVSQSAVGLRETANGVSVRLGNGASIPGDLAIIATGYGLEAGRPEGDLQGPLDEARDLDPEARVVIIGSGLSMVDRVVSLRKSGHRGEIIAVSRRGLLPRSHAPCHAMPIAENEVPLGAPISVLLGWVRGLADRATQQGGTWRDAIDGIRPYASAIWRALPREDRSRFLRHAVIWWDVHRHRIPPASDEIIRAARADGQLKLQRGKFVGTGASPDGDQVARVVCRETGEELAIPAGAIFDCRGRLSDSGRRRSSLMADLLDQGQARIDPLKIGLDVDLSCRVLNGQGEPSDRILAVGPASRSAFWEMTAMPDIRQQTARLAGELAQYWSNRTPVRAETFGA